MTFTFILTGILFILAIIILMGKGDILIAGYNTMIEKERAKVNVLPLRLITTAVLVISAIFCAILPFINDGIETAFAILIFIAVSILYTILANTWGKKK